MGLASFALLGPRQARQTSAQLRLRKIYAVYSQPSRLLQNWCCLAREILVGQYLTGDHENQGTAISNSSGQSEDRQRYSRRSQQQQSQQAASIRLRRHSQATLTRASVIAAPMPAEPPVTIAFFPASMSLLQGKAGCSGAGLPAMLKKGF